MTKRRDGLRPSPWVTDGGCAVTRFDCATRRPPGGGRELTGRCQTLNGQRVVRFLEYDDLPQPGPNGLTG